MKIVIDISPVVYGTGVSEYTKNLVRKLLWIDKSNEYTLLGMSLRRQNEIKKFISSLQGTSFKGNVVPIAPSFADVLWNKWHRVPLENFTGKVDVYHSSDWVQIPSLCFKVTTIHDISPIKYPEYTPKKAVSVHKRKLDWVVKEVDRVIVPSEFTKKEVIRLLGISDKKIRVIPEANDEKFIKSPLAEIGRVKQKYKLRDYILSVGTNPRKNTQKIIEAYKKLQKTYKDLQLVVVGEGKSKSEGGVVYTGFVNDTDIVPIYSAARTLVYPSLDEGFGLPILHAFACGVPVVTSDVSSMPEVAGDAAVLVDPQKVDSISEGIVTAFDNKDELVSKGLSRVKEFSWERTAKETLKVYEEHKAK